MRNADLRTATWVVALVLLTSWMAIGWLRYPAGQRLAMRETPFEGTAGLEPDRWRFLQQVRDVLPPRVTVTIRAETGGQEMDLYMLATSVLDEHEVVPATYYGVPNPGAESIRWVPSYRCADVPEGATVVARVPDGCVCERAQ